MISVLYDDFRWWKMSHIIVSRFHWGAALHELDIRSQLWQSFGVNIADGFEWYCLCAVSTLNLRVYIMVMCCVHTVHIYSMHSIYSIYIFQHLWWWWLKISWTSAMKVTCWYCHLILWLCRFPPCSFIAAGEQLKLFLLALFPRKTHQSIDDDYTCDVTVVLVQLIWYSITKGAFHKYIINIFKACTKIATNSLLKLK